MGTATTTRGKLENYASLETRASSQCWGGATKVMDDAGRGFKNRSLYWLLG